MTTIYQSAHTLPPLAATIAIVCIYIMLAGLAIWLVATAGIKFLEMVLDAIEAEKALAQLQRKTDADALNYWIRDAFRQKEAAARERHRADQEAYNKKQIAQGAENWRANA